MLETLQRAGNRWEPGTVPYTEWAYERYAEQLYSVGNPGSAVTRIRYKFLYLNKAGCFCIQHEVVPRVYLSSSTYFRYVEDFFIFSERGEGHDDERRIYKTKKERERHFLVIDEEEGDSITPISFI